MLSNCKTTTFINNKTFNENQILIPENNFSNKGFALIYNENLYTKGIITEIIDNRSLMIFQKNLKIDTHVKVTNILNNKSLIAKVGKKSIYPLFNNSVLSIRIADELDLKITEPYVEIKTLSKKSLFIAKKAKTYKEEKNVAGKAPIKTVSINNLLDVNVADKKKSVSNFSYEIKIADFYFKDSAMTMISRINNETQIKKLN